MKCNYNVIDEAEKIIKQPEYNIRGAIWPIIFASIFTLAMLGNAIAMLWFYNMGYSVDWGTFIIAEIFVEIPATICGWIIVGYCYGDD